MKTAACIRLLVISVLTLLAVALLGSTQVTYAAVTGTVSGTITRDTGASVPNANVTLTDTAGSSSRASVLTTTTSGNGFFTFAGVQPGNYVLNVGAKDFDPASSPVTVQQDFTSTIDFTLEPHRIGGATRIIPVAVRRSDPSTVYVITAKVEQEIKSQPDDLYQFPGLVFGQPGITVAPGDYTSIRGGDENAVGFSVDGVNLVEANDDEFSTNIVSVGMKSLDLYTGGADASYGDSQSGYINEVTHNGKDFAINGKDSGGSLEYTNGEDHGWDYQGTHDEFGGITPDNKFDYYFSTIMFRSNFPGDTQIQSLPTSSDELAKFNYYIDKSDTFTGYLSEGYEDYDYYQPYNPETTPLQTIKFTKNASSSVDTGVFQQDHVDQHYNFNYMTFQHDLTPSSFLSYRIYGLTEPIEAHLENTYMEYGLTNTVQTGQNLDYSNTLSSNDTLKAGLLYLPQFAHNNIIEGGGLQPLTAGDNAYFDFDEKVNPVKTEEYLTNTAKFDDEKVSLTTGLRASSDTFNLNGAPSYTDHYVDPRLGLDISPSRSTVFRTSYSVDSEYPGAAYMEFVAPETVGDTATVFGGPPYTNMIPEGPSQFPTAQAYQSFLDGLAVAPYDHLQTQHTNDFDLGAEQAFNALGGSYDLTVTGYRRYSYDEIQQSSISTASAPVPLTYGSAGHGHTSGIESKLTLDQRKKYDWNGFLSYTNQVSNSTDSFVGSGYEAYYQKAFGGAYGFSPSQIAAGDQMEFPNSWSQRHTIGVLVNKRVTNLVEMSAFLDAGSGYPFNPNSLIGIDADHDILPYAGSKFAEVPVTLQGTQLSPFNPVPGQTGWHYKISLNTNFHVSQATSLFLNVDNVFDKQTVTVRGTATLSQVPYYLPPSPQYPEGRIYYGPTETVTPVFVTVGVKTTF